MMYDKTVNKNISRKLTMKVLNKYYPELKQLVFKINDYL